LTIGYSLSVSIGKTALKRISRARLTEARVLYWRGKYDGSIYLCGFAAELALKRKVVETLDWRGFPDKDEFAGLASFKTHNLDILLKLSGKERAVQRKNKLWAKWLIVKQWDPEVRYRMVGSVTKQEVYETIQATETLLRYLGL